MQVNIRKIWSNEHIRNALTLVLIFVVVYGGAHVTYIATQLALRTEYPALAVASGSMLPTLNIGDLIIVQGVNPKDIRADRLKGDILVFRDPYNPSGPPIVHRAVKLEKRDGYYLITTLGDHDRYGERDQFSPWNSSLLIGKVVARVPYIGNLPLIFQAERSTFIILLAFITAIFALLFITSGKEKPHEEKVGKRYSKIFQFAIVNLLIIGLLIIALWLPTATIRGMYADVDFHRSYGGEPELYWGPLIYRIDLKFNDGVRSGVPTFSWAQLFAIIFILFNFWMVMNFLRERGLKRQI